MREDRKLERRKEERHIKTLPHNLPEQNKERQEKASRPFIGGRG